MKPTANRISLSFRKKYYGRG